jgi:putative ABC transport system substrate-binding protein
MKTVLVLLAVGLNLLGCRASAPVARIGLLSAGSPSTLDAAIFSGLQTLGYVEGHNLVVERRFAWGQPERLPDLAAELLSLQLRVIVATGVAAARAAHDATRRIPIVAITGDLVESRLIADLQHPGGNVTGIATGSREAAGKRLDLLRVIAPNAKRIAVIWNPDDPSEFLEWKATSHTADALGMNLESTEVRSREDLERSLTTLPQSGAQGIVIQGNVLTISHAGKIAEEFMRSGIPAIATTVDFVHAGGLMAFGPNLAALHRRAATQVDQVLRGRDPAQIPVEQPAGFELAINLGTARAMDLSMPPALLLLAKTVIQP